MPDLPPTFPRRGFQRSRAGAWSLRPQRGVLPGQTRCRSREKQASGRLSTQAFLVSGCTPPGHWAVPPARLCEGRSAPLSKKECFSTKSPRLQGSLRSWLDREEPDRVPLAWKASRPGERALRPGGGRPERLRSVVCQQGARCETELRKPTFSLELGRKRVKIVTIVYGACTIRRALHRALYSVPSFSSAPLFRR